MSMALGVQNLSKRYGRKWALRDCTVKLPSGHVVALVGPNGAGKTTLLQLAAGLLKPSAGDVRVFGCDPHTYPREMLPRVGFVAQDHPLYKHFTVADLLTMGRKMNPLWDQRIAEERLAMLDIPLQQRAGKLSGGQQAQVALSLGVAAGAITRHTIPGMIVTLIGYIGVRDVIANLVRPYYLPPLSVTWDPYLSAAPKTLPGNQDWITAVTWTDHAGHFISNNQIGQACNSPVPMFGIPLPLRIPLPLNFPRSFDCTHAYGWLQTITWQPVDRAWLFQGIESAIFFGMAAGLLVLAYWWIRERIS